MLVALRVVASQPEPCCTDRCRYSPVSIRKVLGLLARYCTADEIDSVLSPRKGYDTDHLTGFGPSFGPTWRLYVADLDRALRAGHKTPEAMARYLCPGFYAMGEDEA